MQSLALAVRRASAAPLRSAMASSACAVRSAMPARAVTGLRFQATEAGANAEPVYTNPKSYHPEYLMKFKHYHSVKEMVHRTSYFLAAGIPLTILLSGGSLDSICTVLDWGMTFAIPAHFHVGMRTVLLDYAHFWWGPAGQARAYKVLAAITVLTVLGLAKFNLKDVGITKAVTMLFQEQPQKEGKAAHH